MSRVGASIHIKAKPAGMPEKQRAARRLAYLSNVSKILTHLGNEFGVDAKLPSVSFIEAVIAERVNQQKLNVHYANRRA